MQGMLRRRTTLSWLCSVLIVCLIVGAFVVYSRSAPRLAHAAIPTVKSLSQHTTSYGGWNYAVVGVGQPGITPALNVYDYNPINGHHAVFVPQPPYLPLTTQIDGVSSDGHNLLYQFSQSGHTLYYTQADCRDRFFLRVE